MTQKFFKLIVLVSYILPMQIYAEISFDLADISDETNTVRKPFNSLQVAGPLAVTGLTSLNALNVKNGADFGSDVAIDGNLYADGGIVLDSCLVMTCTGGGVLLVNGQPITAGGGGGGGSCNLTDIITTISSTITNTVNNDFANTFTALAALGACMPIPLTASTGYTITTTGYYCLAGDIADTITISSSDVTLDLNNHTITPGTGDGIDVSGLMNRITIKNGNLSMSTSGGGSGIDFQGMSSERDFHIHDVNIDGASSGILAGSITNLDIARVIVTNSSGNGFDIENASNVTLFKCQASSGTSNGFYIEGTAGSSVLLDSCVAAGNTGYGFEISQENVTLTNCVSQANSEGFQLDTSANNIMLENCIANFNNGSDGIGFNNNSTIGICSFISCIAQNNARAGFDMQGSGGSGLIKSCIAQGNGIPNDPFSNINFGFLDSSPTNYQYIANAAEGNGPNPGDYLGTGTDTNYGAGSSYPDLVGTATLTYPYYQSLVNTSGSTGIFAPTFWNNITLQ